MSGNILSWSQGLLTIVADTTIDDTVFAPEEVWTIPEVNITNSYLTVTLETVVQSGRQGIRVVNSADLPGTSQTVWTLEYTGYQSAAEPSPLIWISVPLDNNVLNHLITEPIPSANYRFRLVATESGRTPVYHAEATVVTGNDTTYITLQNMADDGILSAGTEKVSLISRYNNAVGDKDALIRKASALNIGYTDLSNAFSALDGYLTGLSPAWNTTTVDTQIDKTIFLSTWNTFDVARARLATSLQGLIQSLNAAVATNQNISSTSVSSFDGYTVQNGNKILLAGQTTTSQNGIYSTAVTSASASTARVLPTVGTSSGSGSYANDVNAHDNTAGTSATLTSPVDMVGTESVIYSGFSGTQTSGTISAILSSVISGDGPAISINAYYSTDGGTNYTLFTNGTFSTNTTRTLTATVSGINLANLRIKIDAPTALRRVKSWDNDLMEWYFTSYWSYSVATIQDVYIDVDAISAGTTTLSKVAEVSDGETYLILNGSSYGGKNVTISRPTTTGAITLTATTPPFQAALPSYSAAPVKVLQNTSGVLSWVDPATGGGGGSVTSVGGTGTVSGLTLSGTVTTSGNLTLGGSITGFQPVDADLTAIAGLTGTSGLLKKTAADTWSLDTTGYTTNTGTVTSVGGTGTVSGLTLTGTVTGSGSLTLGGSITGFQPVDADLTSIAGLAGTTGILTKSAANTWALDTTAYSPTTHNHSGTYAPAAHSHLIADLPAYPTLSSLGAQASDADLTAIAALSGTSGNLTKTGINTWALDTNTYSLSSHDHTGVYSPIGHNHSGVYQPAFSTNTPTGNSFVIISPGNVISYDNNTYSQTNHNHTGTYEPKLSGTGFVRANAGVITYDTATYLTGITSGNVTTALGYTPYQEGTALDTSTITATGNVQAISFSTTPNNGGYVATSNATDYIGLTVNQTTTGKAIVKLNTSSKEARITVSDADVTMTNPSSVSMNNIAGSVLFTDSANVPFGSIGSAGIATKGPIKAYGATFSAPVDFALNVAQTVNGLKFFNSNGNDTNYIYTAGAGGLNFRNNADSATVASISNTGALTATSLAIAGGASTSFLKADGSVDSSAYSLTSHTHSGLGAGTVTSVGGTGTVSGLTLSGTVTSTGNLTLGGSITGFQPTLSGTGFVKSTAGTISYDTSTYSLSTHNHTGTYANATHSHLIADLPAYPTLSGLGGQAALTGTGFVKSTAGTISYDTSTYSVSTHNHSGTYAPASHSHLIADLPAYPTLSSLGALATNGSAASLTNFPTLNQNTTGSAGSVTSLSGHNVSELTNNSGYLTSAAPAYNTGVSLDCLSFPGTGTPTNGYLITTNIPASQWGMYLVTIKGYAYGDAGAPFETLVSFYLNNNPGYWNITNQSAISSNYDPGTITISKNASEKITIHLSRKIYYNRFFVQCHDGTSAFSTLQGWSVSDAVSPAWAYSGVASVTTVITSANIGSQSVNYAVSAGSAGSVPWTGVTGKPTALSSFTNDLGNYGSWITASGSCNYATSAGSATNATLATEAGKLTASAWDNNNICFHTTTLDGTPDTAAIQIRERSRAGIGTGVAGEAPTIGFHWGGRTYSHVGIDSSCVLTHWNSTRTAYNPIRCSTLYASDVQSSTFAATTGFTATSNTSAHIGLTVNHTSTGKAIIKLNTNSKDIRVGVCDSDTTMLDPSSISMNNTAGSLLVMDSSNTPVGSIGTNGIVSRGPIRSYGAYFSAPVDFPPNVYNTIGSNKFFAGNGSTLNYIYTGSGGLLFRNTADSAQIASLDDAGNFAAANFSGSHSGTSSGTNTGDQTLPTWSTLSGRPTNLSSFTNDLGNYGSWITASGSCSYATSAGSAPANGGTATQATLPYCAGTNSGTVYLTGFTSQTAQYGYVYTNGVYMSAGTVYATDFSASSDRRLKKDITPITGALDKISKINGVNYKWNELSTIEDKDTIQAGVIAQEVLAVYPEAVNTKDEYMSVSYDRLVPLLIEGMKEQQQEIKELKEMVKMLMSKDK